MAQRFGTVTDTTLFTSAHFSENWGYLNLSPIIGGNLFSIAFGRNLDAHALSEDGITSQLSSSTDHQCLQGRECYVAALYMTIVASVVAMALGVWAGWRERRKLSKSRSATETKHVAWEIPDGPG